MEWELLAGVPEQTARRVLASARRRRFPRGQAIFHEGEAGASVHLVARGRVAVRVMTPLGDVATLDVVVPGAMLGEMALLCPGERRSATAVALETTETLVIDEAVFSPLRREEPAVADALFQVLGARMRQLNGRLLEAYFVPTDTRVLRRVLELVEVYGDVVAMTQEDLAGLAGTTRATVNRVLRREEERGSLSLGRGRVTVIDQLALAHRAGRPLLTSPRTQVR